MLSRLLGLIPYKTANQAPPLLILNCNAIHTFFMRFPITILFLDQNMKIIKIKTNLNPFRFCICKKAKHVLEIPVVDHL